MLSATPAVTCSTARSAAVPRWARCGGCPGRFRSAGLRRGQVAVRQGHGRRLGRTRHRRRARPAGGPAASPRAGTPGANRMTFCVVTYRDNGETHLGVLLADGGGLLDPAELKQWATMLELLENWPQASEVLATLPLQDAPPGESAELLTPIGWPRQVMCAGVNYRKHIKEMGGEVPGDDWIPFFFLKPPSTAVTGPADPILIRDQDRARFDWEAELAVVIGVGGRDIPVRRAPA